MILVRSNCAQQFSDNYHQTIWSMVMKFPAQEMLDLVVKDVTEFAGDTELSDDITIVVIRHIE